SFHKKLTTGIFYLSILLFIIAFNFSDNGGGGWTQQFMPFLNNKPIADITFLDSLTGYAVTGENTGAPDTNYVLKTTDAGNNWNVILSKVYSFRRIIFLNHDTGYASNIESISRTTNAGLSWENIPLPPDYFGIFDMFPLSYDTMWITLENFGLDYIYRTTNAGLNWTNQFQGNSFDNLYFFNNRIGFVGSDITSVFLKTTNSGINWLPTSGNGFYEMFFIDSLVGWKAKGYMNKTTDGGETWINQSLPSGGNIFVTNMLSFSNINKDTIWGTGGVMRYGNSYRGMLYRTTNGGANWAYQIPDTSIHLSQYWFCRFINKSNGWMYVPEESGVHTTIGGDTTFYTGIIQTNTNIPKDFALKQNYPNPFNPRTVIPFSLKKSSYIKLTAYDVRGVEIQKLADGKYSAGEYEVDFMGKFSSSGVYFYKIEVTPDNSGERFIDTKRMMLLK
ncbi:MAG: hypothetical protein KBF96_10260, partial [Ignavibacteria bacterium]|nr:hypothetical protein [Ignavibacteria bacterium]